MAVIPYKRIAGYANIAGMYRLRLLIGLLGLVVAILLSGCRGERTSSEAEVRTLIDSAVTAAEQKNIGTLKDIISEKYADEQGQNKRAVERLLRLHFLRNDTVHLYAHIQSVTLPQPDRAQATVLVAMAGVPIASAQELPTLRADLHRFEFDFAREGKSWHVQRATWRRAELGEFLSP
jgi:hypothetical protein